MAIFEYPITITADELKTEKGIDLTQEYGAELVTPFLNEVAAAIYESAIYITGDRDIKERIINANLEKVTSSIKRALILQAAYMNDTGNVGTESGIAITGAGASAVVSLRELRSKNVCPAAIDALKSCAIPLLYAGETV
jgi:hypothetical protein